MPGESARKLGKTPMGATMRKRIAIIGGGPAGLRAAEVAATSAEVTLFDAKPSVGRKFLVAGKGGLNITHAEDFTEFAERYRGPNFPEPLWTRLLSEFDAEALREWAAGLGIETFVASTGRVYPKEMKAAPLLRRWVERLRTAGVTFKMNHRWTEIRPDRILKFSSPEGIASHQADAVILALGGGSWPETGSDGDWVSILENQGLILSPLTPSNCGWEVDWPSALLAAEGLPLKNITARAGELNAKGELLITRYGLEGGIIYQLGPALRENPHLTIDLKPSVPVEQLVRKLGLLRGNFVNEARSRWRLSDAAFALLSHLAKPVESGEALAQQAKALPVALLRPRPLAEAISTAGGVAWTELDENLMLTKLPGIFCAGEMIDWEAPTGGYLMQGCFASATYAANSALAYLRE